MSGSTGEQPAVTPTVSTAPARSRWSKLPAHLGRARTSTVVLVVLFLSIGTLWLNIRPETPDAGTPTTGTSDQQPATTTPTAPTTAETTTPAPETTDSEPTTTEESTTSEPTSGTIDSPTPTEPTETDAPTATLPTPSTPPTTVSPPG
jgi:hypothetical protein